MDADDPKSGLLVMGTYSWVRTLHIRGCIKQDLSSNGIVCARAKVHNRLNCNSNNTGKTFLAVSIGYISLQNKGLCDVVALNYQSLVYNRPHRKSKVKQSTRLHSRTKEPSTRPLNQAPILDFDHRHSRSATELTAYLAYQSTPEPCLAPVVS